MNFTTFREPRLIVERVALAALAGVAMVSAGWMADPYEPARAAFIGVALIALALMFDRTSGKHSRRSLDKLGRIAAAAAFFYVSLSLVSAVANGFESSLFGVHGRYQGLVSLLVLTGVGVAGITLRPTQVSFFTWALLVFGAVQASMIGLQLATGAAPQGFMGNTVPAGAILAIAASTGGALAALGHGRSRTSALVMTVICAIGATATSSRGALIALISGIVVGAALYLARRGGERPSVPPGASGRIRSSAALVVAVVAVMALLVGMFVVLGGGAKLSPESLQSGSAKSRWAIWESTGALVGDNVLFGVGPGRFLYEYPQYQTLGHATAEAPDVRADQAHSILLQTASESGLPAAGALATLYVIALISGVRGVRRRDGAAALALAGFVAYLAQGLFGVHSVGVDSAGWLLGGVLIARTAASGGPSTSVLTAIAWRKVLLFGILLTGAAVVVLSAWYGLADAAHLRAITRFQSADFDAAWEAELRAVEINPLVDVYRVGLADVATYGTASQRYYALELLEEGLTMELQSYDLLAAKARLLASSGAPAGEVADGYEAALAAYPLGLSINLEAAEAFQSAGRAERAADVREMAERLVRDGAAPE